MSLRSSSVRTMGLPYQANAFRSASSRRIRATMSLSTAKALPPCTRFARRLSSAGSSSWIDSLTLRVTPARIVMYSARYYTQPESQANVQEPLAVI